MNRIEQLALQSTLAVSVLTDEDVTTVELLELKPIQLSDQEAYARTVRRGITQHLGVMGLVNGLPRAAFSRELDPVRLRALAHAFRVYCEARFEELVVATAAKNQELTWLESLFGEQDPRAH